MAVALVQAHAATSFGTSTVAITWSSNTTTGNCIWGAVWWNDATMTLSSVTDSQSNTYDLYHNPTTANGKRMALFRAKNITGGTTPTVTATFSGSPGTSCISAEEISGADTTEPLDQHTINSGAASTATDAVTSGSVTTTADGEYIGGVGHTEFNTTLTAGTNFTLDDGSGDQIFIEHKTTNQSSAGSIAATFTEAVNDAWMCGIMTFKEPAGAVPNLSVSLHEPIVGGSSF